MFFIPAQYPKISPLVAEGSNLDRNYVSNLQLLTLCQEISENSLNTSAIVRLLSDISYFLSVYIANAGASADRVPVKLQCGSWKFECSDRCFAAIFRKKSDERICGNIKIIFYILTPVANMH